MPLFLLLLVGLISYVSSAPEPPPVCGYQSCPPIKEDLINLHLVAHTHDDVGWLKTYDQYYYGSKNKIQDAGVQYILDSVVQALLQNPKRRFIYVETAFFWKWWKEQDETSRRAVRHLVDSGRLEIIGGGWSMNDEATTHYQSIIDQFAWGFRRLDSALGRCGRPRIGWQIDPFGHSRESAAIMAQMGFHGLFLGRIDWEDKMNRIKNKTMEVIWYTDPYLPGGDGKLWTGVMYSTYSAPKGFCFDIHCPDEPIIDSKESPDYNAQQRASDFLQLMENYAKAYRSKHIIVTMGGDFQYEGAHVNFKNLDKLIEQINSQSSKFHALYSTPSCYLRAVHAEGLAFPTKEDDFLPYSSDPTSFWSGYFSSRPTIKRYERLGNNFLQIVKQLSVLTGGGDSKSLNELREAMGTMQHHDAVTGTEKQHVANDYSRILTDAITGAQTIAQEAIGKIIKQKDVSVKIESCLQLNISQCGPTESGSGGFVVTVYNPLSRSVSYLVRVPVYHSDSNSFTVTDPQGKELITQILEIPEAVLKIPGRTSKSQNELAWLAENLPPIGFASYHVFPTQQRKHYQSRSTEVPFHKKAITIGQDKVSITIGSNGDLKGVKLGREVFGTEQGFHYYIPAVGNNEVYLNRSSGAYIFRPNGSEQSLGSPTTRIFKGPLVTEVHQKFSNWVSQVIRCVKGSELIEFEWLVGPIPIEEGVGKEVVWRFRRPDLKTGGLFETDSNGRQHLQRKLNHRDDWTVHLAERVPGNYYPVVTDISVSSDKERLTFVTDRSVGGSSLTEGQVELMVHRRLTHDDAFGVDEALNETAFGTGLVASGRIWLHLNSNQDTDRQVVQEKSILAPWLFLTKTSLSYRMWKNAFKMEYSGISAPLPDFVQILTLEPWSHSNLLLRLEHTSTGAEDVDLDLGDLFTDYKVIHVEEMTLDGNLKIGETDRPEWKEEIGNTIVPPAVVRRQLAAVNVTIKPMQIRTFVLQVVPRTVHHLV